MKCVVGMRIGDDGKVDLKPFEFGLEKFELKGLTIVDKGFDVDLSEGRPVSPI